MTKIMLLALFLVGGCASSEPNWCHRWHPVYKNGRRCASGREVPNPSEPVVYVDDCNSCYQEGMNR